MHREIRGRGDVQGVVRSGACCDLCQSSDLSD